MVHYDHVTLETQLDDELLKHNAADDLTPAEDIGTSTLTPESQEGCHIHNNFREKMAATDTYLDAKA